MSGWGKATAVGSTATDYDEIKTTKDKPLVVLLIYKAPSCREDLAKHAQRQGGGDAYIRICGV